jgi:hypothetical protein
MDEKRLREMAVKWAEHDWEQYAFREPADLATGYFDFAVLVLAAAGVPIPGQRHPDDELNKLGARDL